MSKIYELTTNGKGGYQKYYVKGIKTDAEARKVAKRAFGNYYWDKGVSYYDNYPSKRNDWSKTPSKSQFIKKMKGAYSYQDEI